MRGVDTTTPVVVLKLARGLFPHGGLSAVRSLGRLGAAIYGFHDDRWAPAAFSRFDRGKLVVQLDASAPAAALAYLSNLSRDLGVRPVLLPTEDVSALFVDGHRSVLDRWYIFPKLCRSLARSLANKQKLYSICNDLQIPAPHTVFPTSIKDVQRFIQTSNFPVMLKSIDPEVLQQRPQAKSTVIAHGPKYLLQAYEQMEVPSQPNLMLQEYIPGDLRSHWMVSAYFDQRSECLLAFTGQKLRESQAGAGFTTLGICARNEEVERLTRNLLTTIGYRGIVDAEWRYDARDGRYKLLDVNPRMGAQFRAFVGVRGMDAVRALYLDLTGQPVVPDFPHVGRRWVVENHDLIAWLSRRRRRGLSFRSWLRSFRGVQEGAWFATDDQAPFWVMCVRAFAELSRRAVSGEKLIREMGADDEACVT